MAKIKLPKTRGVLILGALLGFGLLLAICALLLSLSGTIASEIIGSDPEPVRTSTKDRLAVLQAYLSGMAGRVEERNSEIYYYLTPKINLQVKDEIDTPITKVEVMNVNLSNYPEGAAVKVLAPYHVNPYEENIDPYFNVNMLEFDFNFDKFESSKIIEYDVVEGAFTQYIDDFAKEGDFLEFLVLVHKAGNFDEASIINRDRMIDSSKYLQYAGLEPDSLSGELSFNVQVTFENGEQTFKKFQFEIDGEEMVNTGFMNFDPKIDGQQF